MPRAFTPERKTERDLYSVTSVRRIAVSALGVVVFVLAACGGGGNGAAISTDSLSDLVLQPKDMQGFTQFDWGRQVTLDNSAGARRDPARFGREGGWKARYRRRGTPDTTGPLVVESRADLFDGESGAKKDLAAYNTDLAAAFADAPAGSHRIFGTGLGDASVAITTTMPGLTPSRFFRIAWRYRNATASVLVQGFEKKIAFAGALRLARIQQRHLVAAAG